ncbi:MAG: hypothetical protein K2X81_02785 [Candidatus Obscuribacterales bacterium]|nr:hypothetical protein [Candidatus Obscuribacterales bacterium]
MSGHSEVALVFVAEQVTEPKEDSLAMARTKVRQILQSRTEQTMNGCFVCFELVIALTKESNDSQPEP